MALTRRYDGEPIVRVELDTSVELDVSVNGSCGETVAMVGRLVPWFLEGERA